MKFRTEYEAGKAPFSLDPRKPAVLVGSCFSQNIASRMQDHLWEGLNPTGTLYNPESIAIAIDLMLDHKRGTKRFEDSLFLYNGIWHSRFFDSSFSSSEKEECLRLFEERSDKFRVKLLEGKVLIVTFGTAICYKETDTGSTVGNCHKLPASIFFTRRATPEEIVTLWNTSIGKLRQFAEDINLIFTVSPVRHLKNGFVGNSRSKAVLQLAVEDICESNPNCFYFPAYEILNDDLRDYRFYASDLAHPSDAAVEYIWEKFLETFVAPEDRLVLKEGSKKMKSLRHRPIIEKGVNP